MAKDLSKFLLCFLFVFSSAALCSKTDTIKVSGYAYSFANSTRISDGHLTLVDSFDQEIATLETDIDGQFGPIEIAADQNFHILFKKSGFRDIKTALFNPGEESVDGKLEIVLQVPGIRIFKLFHWLIWGTEIASHCHVAGTVLAAGKNHDDLPHGDGGVVLTAENEESGEIFYADFYFGIFSWVPVLIKNKTNPLDWYRQDTSEDGGFLFSNLPEGNYIVRATKPGTTYSESQILCRPGEFINLNPPHGPTVIVEE